MRILAGAMMVVAAVVGVWGLAIGDTPLFLGASVVELLIWAATRRERVKGSHPHSMDRDKHFD